MSWGGKRAGAGRPTAETTRHSMTFSVGPDISWKAAELRRSGVKVNREVENMIRTLYDVRILHR